ncbi:hypothetical protein J4Q44_G00268520 [Coregonus suidteri]|uniref:Ig-like domain-containing protein n=1 Tax=Coregonus suidteri TaxID=861788 RepID=A0AAN8QUP9_9TELE
MNPIRYVLIELLLCSFISLSDVRLAVKHELQYVYTYFNSSHYEVVGLLDGELVDFYSRGLNSPVPKKRWNENETSFGYYEWKESISSRQDINTCFLSSAVDLKRHFVKHHLGGDIVQMRLGCTKTTTGGLSTEEKDIGFAEFAYNGNTVLLLSHNSNMWIPKDEDAQHIHTIAQKLNTLSMKDTFTNFVNVKCPVVLDSFRSLESKNSSAPKVYTVPSGSLKPGWVNLTCLITGSYPKSSPIEMNLFRDNILLTEMDGVHSSGVRPNEDHTYQLRKTVRINASESVVYRCDVNHKSFPKPRNYTWEVKKQEEEERSHLLLAVVAVVAVVVVAVVVAVLFFKNRRRSESNEHLAAPNPEENAALRAQVGGSLTDPRGDATSVNLSSERDVLSNDPDAEGENDEAYGSCRSSDSDLSQIQIT